MSKVSTAFVFYQKKILLFHRDNKPNIPDPDCWDVIGGHADEGETSEETLIREVKEEIGVDIESPTHFAKFNDHWGAETDLYIVELNDEQAKSVRHGAGEGQGIEFFAFDELKNLKLTQNMKKYMKDYDSVLKQYLL